MTDAEVRYAAAKDLVDRVRQKWDAEGCPLTTEGGATGRATVTHPLVILMMAAERDAAKFEEQLRKRHRGPAPSAVVAEDVGRSPAAKLRAVR